MIASDMRARLIACALAGVAGYVDATGFLASGGFFVSFMSGNSTRLGVALMPDIARAALIALLIGAFVAGVFIGSLLVRADRGTAQWKRMVPVGTALALAAAAHSWMPLPLTLALIAFAMGSANVVLDAPGGARIGVTYMTGALVRVGEGLAAAVKGEDAVPWRPWAILWCSLVGGATSGAWAYRTMGFAALWIAVMGTILIAGALRLRGGGAA